MKPLRRPGIFAGALVGAMLTAALIAVFYAGWQLAGLPFVPFDVFDWVARVLPGRVIAFGIGSMVAVIRALNLGPTSVVAKMAEQAMGITGLFVTGVVAGAVLFALLRTSRPIRLSFGAHHGHRRGCSRHAHQPLPQPYGRRSRRPSAQSGSLPFSFSGA